MHIFTELWDRAQREPDAIFCHFEKAGTERVLTVGAIVAEATAIGGRVRAAGARPGQVVPIVLEHRPQLYSAFIGCALAGLVPTLLPPLTHKQHADSFDASLRALMHRIEPPCLVASRATLPTLGGAGCRVIDLDAFEQAEPVSLPEATDPDSLACLQHSSGTTGLKKGVCLSHRMVRDQVARYARAMRIGSGDSVASWLPLYHDMGLFTAFLMPAICGLPVASLDALEWSARPASLLDAIERRRATLCWLPNFAFHHVARAAASQAGGWDLSSLRAVVSCSEPCRTPAFDALAELLPRHALQASYAMAETVFAVTQTAPGEAVRASPHPDYPGYLSSGRPIEGVRVAVRDAAGCALDDGVLGEIHLAAPFLFSGYFRDPARSAERLRDGWYSTGDLGFLEGGELFVVGRRDDVLNINGRKLVAHEIEDALALVPGVAPGRVLVFADHDAEIGATRLCVAAERAEPQTGEAGEQAMKAAIRRAVVAACAVPAHRVTLLARGALVKSTSGKLSRQASIDRLRRAAQPAG